MATAEATPVKPPAESSSPTTSTAAPADSPKTVVEDGEVPNEAAEDGNLKRKAPDDNPDDASPKRARHESHDDSREAATEPARRSRSPSRSRAKEEDPSINHERRRLAAQEEKKRGRRLFGGLMSTLSQTSSTSSSQQQKRRLEIERRQQERMQKQKAEDDQRRAERLERLREARVTEQIAFEEAVMKNEHKKRLALARFLRTRSVPRIHYLPWKTTPEQEDIIDDQIREAKESIAREVEQFKIRKQRHIEHHGPPTRQRSATPDEPVVKTRPDAENSVPSPPHSPEAPPEQQQQQQPPAQEVHHEQHDESGDVLVEAEEDMVIY